MLNQYPLWKYLMVLSIFIIGLIYAAPNLYPDDYALQITPEKSTGQVDQSVLNTATEALKNASISYFGDEISDRSAIIRLTESEDQLRAQAIVQRALADLSEIYIVAQNLVPTTPDWLLSMGATPMKYGLDLSGGVHFLMEVDMEQAVAKRIEIKESDIKRALRQEKIRYRRVKAEENGDLLLQFRKEEDQTQSIRLIKKDFQELVEVQKPSLEPLSNVFRLSPTALQEIEDYAIQQNLTTLRNRVNELGVSEPLVQRLGRDRIVVDLPGVQDTAQAKRILGKVANLEFRLEASSNSSGTETFEFRDEIRPPAELEKELIITGERVANAQPTYDENSLPQVRITLDSKGGSLMTRATRNNIKRRMGVVFIEYKNKIRYSKTIQDGQEVEVAKTIPIVEKSIISLATIQDVLGNTFVITGLEAAEARDLALLLRAGALAAPMYIVEERTVGPSLGKENIELGLNSVIIGLSLVLLFMMVYYQVFGFVASFALMANLILLVAAMSLLEATLTLPGIAGIVLTVGMAVDANVLIFARIKEELSNGLSPQKAIDSGYNRAFVTILDANITTLIAAVILYSVGTGPVKGFAVTLSIGETKRVNL